MIMLSEFQDAIRTKFNANELTPAIITNLLTLVEDFSAQKTEYGVFLSDFSNKDVNQAFKSYYRSEAIQELLGSGYVPPESSDYVNQAAPKLASAGRNEVEIEQILLQKAADLKLGYSAESIRSSYSLFITKKKRERFAEMVQSLSYGGRSNNVIDDVVTILNPNATNLDKTMFRLWIWNAKRRISKKETASAFLLSLYSREQGLGKTLFVEWLFSQIKEFRLDRRVSDITDERQIHTLSEYPFVIFDEMAKATRADIESLKHIITAKTADYRPLYTNRNVKVDVIASYLGTSNSRISEMINDPTGMRRFYDLEIQAIDLEKLKSIDSLDVWKSIDEDGPSPLTAEALEEWKTVQKDSTADDSIEMFFHALESAYEHILNRDITGHELYKYYAEWCFNHSIKPKGHTTFPASFVALSDGAVKRRRTAAGMRYRIDLEPLSFDEKLIVMSEKAKVGL